MRALPPSCRPAGSVHVVVCIGKITIPSQQPLSLTPLSDRCRGTIIDFVSYKKKFDAVANRIKISSWELDIKLRICGGVEETWIKKMDMICV